MPRRKRRQQRPHHAGSVGFDKRRDRWYARLPASADPKRPTRYFLSRAEAERHLLEDAERRAREGNDDPDEPLGEYLQRWYGLHLHRWSAGAARANLTRLRRVPPEIARLPLTELRPDHLQAVMRSMQANGLAPTTQRATRGTIRSALRYALECGLLADDVTRRMESSPPRQREMRAWDELEVARFLRSERGRPLEDAWRLALGTGLRSGELRGLKWEDIDWRAGILTVRRGLSQNRAVVQPTKSRKARRIDLAQPLLEMLRQRKARSKSEWVFPSPLSPALPYSWAGLRHTFERAKARCGDGLRPLTLHGLRHSYATIALSRGVPLPTVAAVLGHADPSITLRTYAWALRADQLKAAEIMGRIVSEERDPAQLSAELSTSPVETRTNQERG